MRVVCVPKMYWDAPMQMVAQQPAAILRCLKIRGGIVAVLGRRTWMAAKATSKTPPRVNSAMIRPEFHWRQSVHGFKVETMLWETHGIRVAAPLECQQETDHARDQSCGSKDIKLC